MYCHVTIDTAYVRISSQHVYSVDMYILLYVCVCVCVCARARVCVRASNHTDIQWYIHIDTIYILELTQTYNGIYILELTQTIFCQTAISQVPQGAWYVCVCIYVYLNIYVYMYICIYVSDCNVASTARGMVPPVADHGRFEFQRDEARCVSSVYLCVSVYVCICIYVLYGRFEFQRDEAQCVSMNTSCVDMNVGTRYVLLLHTPYTYRNTVRIGIVRILIHPWTNTTRCAVWKHTIFTTHTSTARTLWLRTPYSYAHYYYTQTWQSRGGSGRIW